MTQSGQCGGGEDECFMGGVLQSCAEICAVPERGTARHRYLSQLPKNIACFRGQCSTRSLDDRNSHGYPFHNAIMTESSGVELGPLPLLSGFGGEGTNLRLVRSIGIRGWALLGAA